MDPLHTRPSTTATRGQTSALAGEVRAALTQNVAYSTPERGRAAQQRLRVAYDAADGPQKNDAFDRLFAYVQQPPAQANNNHALLVSFLKEQAPARMAELSQAINAAATRKPADPRTTQQQVVLLQALQKAFPAGRPLPTTPSKTPAAQHQDYTAPLPRQDDNFLRAPQKARNRPLPPTPQPTAEHAQKRPDAPLQKAAGSAAEPPLWQSTAQDALFPAKMLLLQQLRNNEFHAASVLDGLLEAGAPPFSPAELSHILRTYANQAMPHQLATAWHDLLMHGQEKQFAKNLETVVSEFLIKHAETVFAWHYERAKKKHERKESTLNTDAALVEHLAHMISLSGLPTALANEIKTLKDRIEHAVSTNRAIKEIEEIHAEVDLFLAHKEQINTHTVTLPSGKTFSVRISRLSKQEAPDDFYLMASTIGHGGFSNLKQVITSDGKIMAARQVRIQEKSGVRRSGRQDQAVTTANSYLLERDALVAADSIFLANETLVDLKKRLYDIIPLLDGDIEHLSRVLSPQQKRQMLPMVLMDVLKPMTSLEQKNMSHRDIKMGNIMWDRNGTFFLADFGLADLAQRKGTLSGTPPYMAPESLLDTKSTAEKVDSYALGLSAVEFIADGHSFATFPLSLQHSEHVPNSVAWINQMRAQARLVKSNYADWQQFVSTSGAAPKTPSVAAIDAAYQQMAGIDPRFADLVFNGLLHPDPARRIGAGDALQQLLRICTPAQLDRGQAHAALQQAAQEDSFCQRKDAAASLLRREYAKLRQ